MDDVELEATQAAVARRPKGRSTVAWSLLVAGVVVALGASGAGVTLAARKTATTPVSRPDPPSCNGGSPKLTVQATGVATATPNILTVTVGVDTTDLTAAQALSDNNTKATALVAALTSNGVASADIQTSGLSVQPDYSYPNQVQTLTGYDVTDTVTATVRKVANAGAIIDAVAGAAGNATRINGLSFSVSDPTAVQSQARASAVREAAGHAAAMAAAAGERLGPVCSLTDQTQLQYPSYGSFATAGALDQSAANVPLEAGTQTDSAQVSLVYSLQSRPVATRETGRTRR